VERARSVGHRAGGSCSRLLDPNALLRRLADSLDALGLCIRDAFVSKRVSNRP